MSTHQQKVVFPLDYDEILLRDFLRLIKKDNCFPRLIVYFPNERAKDKELKHLAKALASPSCPEGVVIDFGESTITPRRGRIIAQLLQTGRCPKGLVLDFSEATFTEAYPQSVREKLFPKSEPR